MIVLGIDPGIASCGWAIIETEKNQNSIILKSCGVIKTSPNLSLGKRLNILDTELKKIIAEFNPSIAIVEEIFFAKNVKTAIIVGHARGVVILSCSQMGLNICEFTPLQIKQAITGFGHATKEQISYMLKNLLKLKELPKDDNTTDAIATGICYINTNKFK
ncbi:MAG: crossover junction endodeoxyribonuclease RuvC [Elusimicrobia bacterium RIFOXYC2_FULL_34_12]|nr:MAG: crossover junction endodeoxyribonuclease RuvC [Elusimicrobia bacterium RIFOXYC2_FULL_34_12]OGS39072.1 MAG: crossover junction endodeoxyribonuclease RuvC [Elusimicrobia bacterium RIFOXYD2_FULL_34_30]HAM39213.1 crossover junction endodeoxyribonuclease RuvC [Elusimicrobiota bacterium]